MRPPPPARRRHSSTSSASSTISLRSASTCSNHCLYFTDRGLAGGLAFALWSQDVRQFLINNARFYLEELHADGFRYDQISDLIATNGDSGEQFCRDLSSTVRFLKPRALQNAEYWPVETQVVSAPPVGYGFDVLQHDALRITVRSAIGAAAGGRDSFVDLQAVAANLYPPGFSHAWQAVTCVENHDRVKVGEEQRIPSLADGLDARS